MADLAKYVVSLELESASYQRKLDQANKKLDRFEKQNQSSLALLKKGFVALAGVVSVGMFTRFVKSSIDAADKMLDLSQRLGASTEALSELEFVAQRSGLRFETLTMGLQRMTRRLAEAAQGSGEAKGALRELGLDAKALSNLSLDQQFEAVAGALSKVENQSHQVRLAMKLFDSEGVALVQAMGDGAEGIRALREEARRLGITLSQEDAQAAARFNDEMDTLGAMARAVGRDIGLWLIPPLLDLSQLFRDIDPATQSMAALRSELAQMKELASDPNIFKRIGFFDIGGEFNFFASQADLLAEIARVEAELSKRSEEAGEKAGEALGRGFGTAAERTIQQQMAAFGFTGSRIEIQLPEIKLEALEASMKDQLAAQGFTGDRMIELPVAPKVDLESLTDETDRMGETFKALGEGMGRGIEDSLADAFMGIETDWGDMLKRMVAQAAASGLLNAIGAAIPGGSVVGKIAGFLGFGGARAEGGPVSPGKAFLVGERGPEMFVPGAAGRIVPNGGGAQVTQNITLHFDVGLESVDQRIAQAAPMVAAAAQAGIARAFGRPSMA